MEKFLKIGISGENLSKFNRTVEISVSKKFLKTLKDLKYQLNSVRVDKIV